jgi:hypothetical protein
MNASSVDSCVKISTSAAMPKYKQHRERKGGGPEKFWLS